MPYKDPVKAREHAKKRAATYRSKLGPKHAENQREFRRRNPGKQAEYGRRWRERHPGQSINSYNALKERVMAEYGGHCACCGEGEMAFLTIDHVNNDGAAHRAELGNRRYYSGAGFYRWLRDNNFPKDGRFQVLCANCNTAKRRPVGCPHQRQKESAA